MPVEIEWKPTPTKILFSAVPMNHGFRECHGGRVYIKVRVVEVGMADDAMLDIETGKVYEHTYSEVELVDIKMIVGCKNPH